MWNRATCDETRHVIEQIRPLDWQPFASLFQPAGVYEKPVQADRFQMVADAQDRKFAALATATEAVLISNDQHLLTVCDQLPCRVRTPGEFVRDRLKSAAD